MTSTRTVRITVSGQLSDRLAPAFEGMTLVHGTGATELVGSVVDQAQLHGLLGRIRDLGLELESVSVTPEEPAARTLASHGFSATDLQRLHEMEQEIAALQQHIDDLRRRLAALEATN